MNGDDLIWGNGLIAALVSVVLGIVGLVSARNTTQRWLTSGLFLQGVLLTFTLAGAYFHSTATLFVGAFAVLGLLVVHSWKGLEQHIDDSADDVEEPA